MILETWTLGFLMPGLLLNFTLTLTNLPCLNQILPAAVRETHGPSSDTNLRQYHPCLLSQALELTPHPQLSGRRRHPCHVCEVHNFKLN